jgi:hypothetical protein
MEEVPNWLEVELNHGDWVLELEMLKDLWMKHSDGSDLLS